MKRTVPAMPKEASTIWNDLMLPPCSTAIWDLSHSALPNISWHAVACRFGSNSARPSAQLQAQRPSRSCFWNLLFGHASRTCLWDLLLGPAFGACFRGLLLESAYYPSRTGRTPGATTHAGIPRDRGSPTTFDHPIRSGSNRTAVSWTGWPHRVQSYAPGSTAT